VGFGKDADPSNGGGPVGRKLAAEKASGIVPVNRADRLSNKWMQFRVMRRERNFGPDVAG